MTKLTPPKKVRHFRTTLLRLLRLQAYQRWEAGGKSKDPEQCRAEIHLEGLSTLDPPGIRIGLPSGKHTKNYGKIHHFEVR